MGHRVNTTKTKRTIGLKKNSTKLPSVIEEDNFKISKLETEDVLSRLGDFPNYSVLFREAHAAIFSETGPLPVSTRHYIAFLGARVAGCTILATLEQSLFLASGGNQQWLAQESQGKESSLAPNSKLRKLEQINVLLCKTPRLLSSDHIKSLTDGDESFSITEAVQALVVLIHTHGLATFLMAAANQQTKPSNGVSGLQKITERKSIEFLDIFDRSLDRKIWKHVQKELKRKRSFSEGEISKNYCSKVGQHPHHPLGPGHKRQVSQLSSSSQNVVKPTLTRYNTDIEKCKKQLHGDIRIQDYCWDEHGYSVLSTFYHDLAVILDEKFRKAKYFINETDDKTSKLTTAIWYYVQSIFGVHHDDYNYKQIDQILDQSSKEFLLAVCNQTTSASPTTHQQNVFSILPNIDKLQMSIVLMEARFLSEMLFATQCVMKYMS